MQPTLAVAAPSSTVVTYRVDAKDVIVDVGGAWDQFAEVNGGVPNVLGRPLWHFVAGNDVRGVWAVLLRHVRTEWEPLAFLYRCDAPGLRRLMQMELVPQPDGGVAFNSRQVRAVEAAAISGRWEAATRQETVVVCGWCARVNVGDWVTADRAIEAFGLTGPESRLPRLTHGICDSCARELRALARA